MGLLLSFHSRLGPLHIRAEKALKGLREAESFIKRCITAPQCPQPLLWRKGITWAPWRAEAGSGLPAPSEGAPRGACFPLYVRDPCPASVRQSGTPSVVYKDATQDCHPQLGHLPEALTPKQPLNRAKTARPPHKEIQMTTHTRKQASDRSFGKHTCLVRIVFFNFLGCL